MIAIATASRRRKLHFAIVAGLLLPLSSLASKKRKVSKEPFTIVRAGHYSGELASMVDRGDLYLHVYGSGKEIVFQTGNETFLHIGIKNPVWPVRAVENGRTETVAIEAIAEPVLDPINLVTRDKSVSLVSPYAWWAPFVRPGRLIRMNALKDLMGLPIPDNAERLMALLLGASLVNVWKTLDTTGLQLSNRKRGAQVSLDAIERFDDLLSSGHEIGVDRWTARRFFR